VKRYRLLLTVEMEVYPTLGPGRWEAEAEVLRVNPEEPVPEEVQARLLECVERTVEHYRQKGLK
jgi:hypothetical protein